jgi:hypothetical protein
MTGNDASQNGPNPIFNIGLEVHDGVLQIILTLKNASNAGGIPRYPPPPLSGMTHTGSAWYEQNNHTPFPKNQWVHTCVYTNFASSNGIIRVWQDGVPIIDVTHPTMDLFNGWPAAGVTGNNVNGDMMLQFGNYGGHADGVQRFYMDDFKVTDYRPVP